MFSVFFKGLARHYGNWQRRQRALEELYALDDRSLADLGISRSEIPYVLARTPERDLRKAQPKAQTLRHAA